MICGGLVTLAYLDLDSVMVPWCFLSVQLLQGTWQYRIASSLRSGAALAQKVSPSFFPFPLPWSPPTRVKKWKKAGVLSP